jgi:small subunit ribosomal protein S13
MKKIRPEMDNFAISGLPVAGRLLNKPPPQRIQRVLVSPRGHAKFPHIMARILGIEIPNEKRIEASLPYMFGIGRPTAAKILEHAGIDPNIRTGQLTEDQLVRIAQVIQTESIQVEGDLRRERQSQLKRLTQINCYRGIRHKRGLPVRGQRTRTNARTRKGKKKTVGVKK